MAGGWAEGSSLWVRLRVPQHPESGAQDQGGEERVRLCGDHGLSGGYVNTATCPVTPWVEVSGPAVLWVCGSARLPEWGRTGEAASWAEPEDVDAGSGGKVPSRGRGGVRRAPNGLGDAPECQSLVCWQVGIRDPGSNPVVKQVYQQWLGHPYSEEARRVLHTEYHQREKSVTTQISNW